MLLNISQNTSQKLLISWDCDTRQSLEFAENEKERKTEKKKKIDEFRSVGGDASEIAWFGGEWLEWFKLSGRRQ